MVMKDGLIQQIGTPLGVYHFPVNQFVAGFIGRPVMSFILCRIIEKDGHLIIDGKAFRFRIPEKKVSGSSPD